MAIVMSPRKPLRALAMSAVLPGFGQLYNGEVNKAIWLYLCFLLLTGPGVAVIALRLPPGLTMPVLVLGVLAALGLWIWGVADSWRGAKARADHIPAPWQLSGVYALVLLTGGFGGLHGTIEYIRAHEVESFDIAGTSMEPALLQHDLVFAGKRYNCRGCKAVHRGDIAIFTYPNDRTLIYVKRIVGLPGDRIDIRGTEVLVNGKSLTVGEGLEGDAGRTWQIRRAPGSNTALSVTVPAGQVFVLGDNRGNSVDSRQFGPVPLDDVVGNVRQIWGSYGDGGVRWGRLGMVPR
jgi:signal peptidase I